MEKGLTIGDIARMGFFKDLNGKPIYNKGRVSALLKKYNVPFTEIAGTWGRTKQIKLSDLKKHTKKRE